MLKWGLLLLALASPLADCQNTASTTVRQVLGLPLAAVKAAGRLLTQPEKLGARFADFGSGLIIRLEHFGAGTVAGGLQAVFSALSPLFEDLFSALVVDLKTVQAIQATVKHLVSNAAQFAFEMVVRTTSFLVDNGDALISDLNIKALLERVGRLPFVRAVKGVVLGLVRSFLQNYREQIEHLRQFGRGQLDKHRASLQPLADGLSTRILLVGNFLHALVDGSLSGCPGDDNPFASPTGSLQGRLHAGIEAAKRLALKLLGFSSLKQASQAIA